MTESIKHIVVVGGGTAGWLTAGRIAAEHKENQAIQVTLVESPNVPIVGVGEGTWPTMRSTLIKLGIREDDFINQCDVSFKQGAKFAKWSKNIEEDFYYHPLVLPQGFSKVNLVPHWQQQGVSQSFSDAVCFQEALCEKGLAPKTIRNPQYGAVANYAYHLNAGKFSQFLQKHCTSNLRVKHVLADVRSVTENELGDIAHVTTEQAGDIAGDLFIDCSGFSALLIGKHYQIPFNSCNDVLFVDNALAVQVPYEQEDDPIASHTISTAQQAGWIWDIGLQHRRGIGHVYSSAFTSEDQAYADLSRYIGRNIDDLSVKKISFDSGYRDKFWHRNCVAVGLAAGFVEPLEASSLVLVELSAQMIAEQLPACRSVMDIIAKRFNDTFTYRWLRIVDFLKLHYVPSQREEAFWQENRAAHSIPESLKELMHLWRYHPPYDHDFTSNNEVFPAASYQYVLYGMGFKTDLSLYRTNDAEMALAKEQFHLNKMNIAKAVDMLPTNRELINKIKAFGLQAI
ncbi:tryptophan halogenase family protein [Alteromonas sp. KUL49]|uniref:tryptophan halogenase family protein n=1 Tax=Alteromonas sp. KUL49 TaxID=2480798 RepID=UPI00102F0333|nr:tryptophan halogenase family protein [Alteromonas sp. KUL49]TAP42327.1 tryptophan 7-halogenase [Alteromonas sp. KUL49]GEA09935.1 tryptophan halogenase [Alteromonas sp. KUL49]